MSITFKEIMSCHEDNQQTFDKIVDITRKHALIPFIGAGISSSWTKYPTWKNLLRNIAEKNYILFGNEVRNHFSSNQYELVASEIESRLSNIVFKNNLREIFDSRKLRNIQIPQHLRLIPQLFDNIILTTNFDRAIEEIFHQTDISIDRVTPSSGHDNPMVLRAFAQSRPLLIKLHGDIEIEDLVLTKEDYDKTYGIDKVDAELPLPKLLKRIFTTKTILFLGCSLEEDRILNIIKECSTEGVEHFALLPLPECTKNALNIFPPYYKDMDGKVHEEYKKRCEFLDKHNISRIWFPYDQYDAIQIIFTELEKEIKNRNGKADVYKQELNEADGQYKMGISLFNDRDFGAAVKCFGSVREIYEKLLGETDVKTLDTLSYISRTHSAKASYGECIEILDQKIKRLKKKYGENSREVADGYTQMAYQYDYIAKYKESIDCFKKSLAVYNNLKEYVENKKECMVQIGYQYAGMGLTYIEMKDYSSALKNYYQILSLADDLTESYPGFSGFVYNGLGTLYVRTEEYGNAEKYLNEAINLRTRVANDDSYCDHIDFTPNYKQLHLSSTYENLAEMYSKQGMYDEALDNYYKAKEEREKVEWLTEDHPAWVPYNKGISRIYVAQKKYDEALECLTKSLEIRKNSSLGTDNILYADIYYEISLIYEELGEYDMTLEYLLGAYRIRKKHFGEKNNDTLILFSKLKKLYEKASKESMPFTKWLDIRLMI